MAEVSNFAARVEGQEKGNTMRVMLVNGQDAPSGYLVPCGFLLVAVDAAGKPVYKRHTTWPVQEDWDFWGLAQDFGMHGDRDSYDDSVDAVAAAREFLAAHSGEIANVEMPEDYEVGFSLA